MQLNMHLRSRRDGKKDDSGRGLMFMIKLTNERITISLIILLLAGSGAMWWVAKSVDNQMRNELLQKARIAAGAVNIEHLASLYGSEKDLSTPAYHRIKSQLSSMRAARYHCKFLYLMGQRSNGVVFFYVDSLPAGSKNYAAPGMIYDEVPESYLRIFDTEQEAAVGPVRDRWGTLMTALVPIPANGHLAAVLGMDVDAKDWNTEIIRRCLGPFVVTVLLAALILLIISRERVHRAFRESEERHRLFFENCPIGIIHYDNHGIITDVNEAIIATFGSSRKKLLGLEIRNIPDKRFAAQVYKSLNGENGWFEGQYNSFTGGEISFINAKWIPIYHEVKGFSGVGIIEDITMRKQMEHDLARRSEFERLITEISSEFIGLSGKETDAGINRALASISTFSGADRAYVFLYRKDGILADNTHEWCATGIAPQIENLRGISVKKELPWFADHIGKQDVFALSDMAALPSEAGLERKHFEAQGIFSLIVVPMVLENRLVGFVGFDAVIKKRIWAESDLAILKLVGEVFTNVIERKNAETEREKLISKLENAMERVKTLSGLLPICSFCKKIRDDKGYWNQLESFIHQNSGAEFSHGICPGCAKIHYPEFDIYDNKDL
jgi:PAS domain S-box-containing protein